MLGILRYLLATMVMLSHLWPGLMWWQGSYAVFCFYLISGYLMSLVANETYTGPGGIKRYALNRVLRIYPIYWLVFALSVLLATRLEYLLGQPLGNGLSFSDTMPIPVSASDWLANLSLLYIPSGNTFSVSPAWSLRVELFFYALIPLLSRRLWTTLVWLGASVAHSFWMEYQSAVFIERYATIAGASIAFSLGATIYHLRKSRRIAAWHVPVAASAYLLHLCFAPLLWGFSWQYDSVRWFFEPSSFGLYGNTALAAYLLYAISCNQGQQPRALRAAGTLAGNLAYPIFCCTG